MQVDHYPDELKKKKNISEDEWAALGSVKSELIKRSKPNAPLPLDELIKIVKPFPALKSFPMRALYNICYCKGSPTKGDCVKILHGNLNDNLYADPKALSDRIETTFKIFATYSSGVYFDTPVAEGDYDDLLKEYIRCIALYEKELREEQAKRLNSEVSNNLRIFASNNSESGSSSYFSPPLNPLHISDPKKADTVYDSSLLSGHPKSSADVKKKELADRAQKVKESKIISYSVDPSDYEEISKIQTKSPIDLRNASADKLTTNELIILSWISTTIGPIPANSKKRLSNIKNQVYKDKALMYIRIQESLLGKLGMKGQQFQSSFPEYLYAVRVYLKNKEARLQTFISEEQLKIEYQFPGAYPLLIRDNVENSEEKWLEFQTELSKRLSQGKRNLDKGIFDAQISSGGDFAVMLHDLDEVDIESALKNEREEESANAGGETA